jgi:hypothetical protein
MWTKRQQKDAIRRIYNVLPTAGECFFIQLLLTTVCGPKSFKNLQTFNSIQYQTYQEACLACGLLEDNNE